MELNITTVQFKIMALEKLHLPEHPGSTFRGAFGRSLRDISCSIENTKCEDCNLNNNCPYSLFFNPFLTEKDKKRTSKRFHNKLRPFIFVTDNEYKKEYKPGEELAFKIRIFGDMKEFLPYVIESWKNLQKIGLGFSRSKFLLKNIWIENDIKGLKKKIYDYKEKEIVNEDIFINLDDIKEKKHYDDKITILFKTPTLLKVKGDFLRKNIKFDLLMRTLFRRLSTLSAFYGEEMDINFSEALKKANKIEKTKENLKWENWYRFSKGQNKKIAMKGIVGALSYQGKLDEFLNYLILAQYINLGKNTVFGQGYFEILNY